MHILIAGGSGYIGKKLTKLLLSKGHSVNWLGRNFCEVPTLMQYKWNYNNNYIDAEALRNADVLINLAGASIAGKRWTKTYKQEIYDSRVKGSSFLYNCLNNIDNHISLVIQSSATGFYGLKNPLDAATESMPPGDDFLAITCADWESSSSILQSKNIRKCIIRTAPVMAADSQAFLKMAALAKIGLASSLGSGRQPFPWIHIDDLCNFFLFAIENDTLAGAYNACAPEAITNRDFTKKLSAAFGKTVWLPNVPSFVLRMVLGDIQPYLTEGKFISTTKISSTGFNFTYPSTDSFLKEFGTISSA